MRFAAVTPAVTQAAMAVSHSGVVAATTSIHSASPHTEVRVSHRCQASATLGGLSAGCSTRSVGLGDQGRSRQQKRSERSLRPGYVCVRKRLACSFEDHARRAIPVTDASPRPARLHARNFKARRQASMRTRPGSRAWRTSGVQRRAPRNGNRLMASHSSGVELEETRIVEVAKAHRQEYPGRPSRGRLSELFNNNQYRRSGWAMPADARTVDMSADSAVRSRRSR